MSAQLLFDFGAARGAVTVRVAAAAWAALRPHAREDMTLPRGGVRVEWAAAGEHVAARVSPDVAATLAGLAGAHGIEMHSERTGT